MIKNAEVTPYNTFTVLDPSASVKEGRGALDDWKKLGYVSTDNTRCISRTVEYSANDYSLSVVAAGEAPGDVEKYLNRSAGWQRIWNPDIESVGFKGFLTPRNSDGTWDSDGYNPAQCGDCSWRSITYEATPWEYSFTVPYDVQSVIKLMGGEVEFERRLDYIVCTLPIIIARERANNLTVPAQHEPAGPWGQRRLHYVDYEYWVSLSEVLDVQGSLIPRMK